MQILRTVTGWGGRGMLAIGGREVLIVTTTVRFRKSSNNHPGLTSPVGGSSSTEGYDRRLDLKDAREGDCLALTLGVGVIPQYPTTFVPPLQDYSE
jgi:hypothetical protein